MRFSKEVVMVGVASLFLAGPTFVYAYDCEGESLEAGCTVEPPGYYDGYDRKLSNAGRALIHGKPVSVIGRVAMNMMMLDVTDAGAQLDDEVVLLGRQGNAEIRVEEMAEKIGTIPYEVVARINPVLPRIPA